MECTQHAVFKLQRGHQRRGSVHLKSFAIFGMVGIFVSTLREQVSAKARYALDAAEQINHLMQIVTA